MKHLYLTLSTIFALIGITTFSLSIINFACGNNFALELLFFSLAYLVLTGLFIWLYIKAKKRLY